MVREESSSTKVQAEPVLLDTLGVGGELDVCDTNVAKFLVVGVPEAGAMVVQVG